jgi:hypothetical protein
MSRPVKTDIDDVLEHYTNEIDRIIGKSDGHLIAADRVVQEKLRDAGVVVGRKAENTSTWQNAKPRSSVEYKDNNDSDDDDGEDIPLLSQPQSQGIRSLFGMKKVIGVVEEQCSMYQRKLQSASDSLAKANNKNTTLQSHIDQLEGDVESIKLYQKKLETELKSSRPNISGIRNRHVTHGVDPIKDDNLRQALFNLEDTVDVSITVERLRERGFLLLFADIAYGWILRLLPLKKELKDIESKFGSSIVSYFLFCRFILMQFIVVAMLAVIFLGFHINTMVKAEQSDNRIVQSSGTMPGFMYMSSYSVNENVYYSALVLGILIFLTTSTIEKVIREDKVAKEAAIVESENACPYTTEVFCAWDNSQVANHQSKATCGVFAQSYSLMLESSVRQDRINKRSRNEVIFLWARRGVILTFYAGFQLVVIVVFLYLSFDADKIVQSAKKYSFLKPVSKYIQSISFQFISTLMPVVADVSTDLEKWDSGHVFLLVSICRNYISNTVNTIVVAIAYYIFADPFLFAGTSTLRKISMSASQSLPCRLDHVADSIFVLVLTTCFSNLLSFVMMPCARYMKARFFKDEYIPRQFDVANSIVDFLLFIGVLLLLVPFSPLSLLFAPVFIYGTLKWQCYWILVCYRKPKKPWKAHKAMPLFSTFYLGTLVILCVLPCFYFLGSKTFAKNCDIQDKYVHLCNGTVSSDTMTCTINMDSKYSATYSGDYPSQLCSDERACGAFIGDDNAFECIKKQLFRTDALHVIWTIGFSYSYMPWVVCIAVCIYAAVMKNSVRIIRTSSANKDKVYEAKILSLEAELAANSKKLSKLQTFETERTLLDI